ncbi:transporter, major facilitator family protein [Bacteriovorax sp. BSW11_IV]|uniref:MFS transporter n=1 Tax=Bacteriovorax sp. BSW11_IV TaxID=1353529 RepID=UPI00038A03E3|nr:MFS transporter [Bacteriovorax sp. BSW11_IV]EQC49512.1 transporter, major facilitator family protein [Bacteriovorax sp. BSW11_IV]
MLKLPKLLQLPNFSKLYYAGLTSELGSFITETALMMLVFKLSTGDKSQLGLMRAAFLISLTLGSLVGGPIGEKFNRRNVLLFANVCRIPFVISLFFFHNFYNIIICDALIAFFTGLYNPSRQAMINDIVPSKDIVSANSLFGATVAILHMIGPFVGATLFAAFGGIYEIITFDLLTYIFGIGLLLKINYRPPQKKAHGQEKTSILHDLKEGLRYAYKRNDLLALLINCAVGGFCIGILFPLLLPFTAEVLKLKEAEYGILLSIFGMGGIVGGFLCHKISNKYMPGKLIVVTSAIEPFIMLTWVLVPIYWFSAAVFFIWGLFVFIRIPSQLNYVSKTVPTEYLSRTHSILDLSFVIPNISGGICVALVGNRFETMDMLLAASVIFIVLIIPRLMSNNMQSLYRDEAEIVTRDESVQDTVQPHV